MVSTDMFTNLTNNPVKVTAIIRNINTIIIFMVTLHFLYALTNYTPSVLNVVMPELVI